MTQGRFRIGRWTLAALALAWIVAPATGRACTSDEECDDGVTCSVPDACVAAACVPGGGGDVDSDGLCDLDDDDDRPLAFNKARVRPLLALAQVSAKVEGFFPVGDGDPFDGLAGFTVEIRDGLGWDGTQTFPAAGCKPNSATTRCKTLVPGKVGRATFKALGPGNPSVKFKLKLTQLPLGGPFGEPLTLRLRQTGSLLDRVGTIVDCKIVTSGIRCRQF